MAPRESSNVELLAELRRMMPALRDITADHDYRQQRDRFLDIVASRSWRVIAGIVVIATLSLQVLSVALAARSSGSHHQQTIIVQRGRP